MSAVATLTARRSGKTFAIEQRLQAALLNALHDAAAPLSVSDLETALRCTRRDLWNAIRDQAKLGNINRGEPIALTAAGRFAVTAGRMAITDWRAVA